MNPIIYEDDKVVVRAAWTEPGKGNFPTREFSVTVHLKIDGVEKSPRGYMLGSSALRFTPPLKEKT